MGEGEDDETVAELQAAVSITALEAVASLCTCGADEDGVALVDVKLFEALCGERVAAYIDEIEAPKSPPQITIESIAKVSDDYQSKPLWH